MDNQNLPLKTPEQSNIQTDLEKDKKEEQRRNKTEDKDNAYKSLAASMVPPLLWSFCLIYSGGSFTANGKGGIWTILLPYYETIGIPLCIISINLGEKALKGEYRKIAQISLMIKAATILLPFFIILFGYFFH